MPENNEVIIQTLACTDCDEARSAAFDAGRRKIKKAVPFLIKLLESQNLGVQEAAEFALREIRGPEVVTALIPLLKSDEAPLRNMAMDILREIGRDDIAPLKNLLINDDPDLRIFVADILGSSEDIGAMEALCEALLRDPEVNVRYQAAMSLGNLGFPAAANALNQALDDEEWVQFAVIESLTKVRAESSILAMVKALNKASDLVASMMIEALGEFGNIKAVPLLAKRLDQSSEPLRNKILKSIVKILGNKSLNLFFEQNKDKFRGYLLAALQDEDEEVQDAAVIGLGVVGGEEASEAIFQLALSIDHDLEHDRLEQMVSTLVQIGKSPALEAHLRSPEELSSKLAVEVLARLNDPPSINLLTTVFANKDRNTQRSIVAHLVNISDPDDVNFFADLLENHTDGDIIKSALYYFAKNRAPERAIIKIHDYLAHRYEDVRLAALDAAINVGGEESTAFFKGRLNAQEDECRTMAVIALGRMDVNKNWEDIKQSLKDHSPKVRTAALKALGSTLPISPKFLPFMLETLNDPDREVRLTLIEILGEAGSPDYATAFLNALHDKDDWVKARAVEALGRLGMQEYVPEITEILYVENPLVAIKAIEALAYVGGEAAFNALLAVLDTGSPDLQGAAEEALAALNDSEGGAW